MHPALSRFEAIDVRTNGITLRVRQAGSGDRLALLLHGFPESWFSWRDQMPVLAELGYRVWAPDLRGYGESDRPRGVGAYAMSELLADVAGLIDAAGAKEVLLVAHDWGGNIAWTFAAKKLRPIDRLAVLNMPHPVIYGKHARRLGPQLLRSWYVYMFQLPFLPEWFLARNDHRAITSAFVGMAVDRSRFPPEVLEVYREAAARPGALTAMVDYYRAALRRPERGRWPRIEVPTLLIWGEEDTAIGKELTYETGDFVRDLTMRYVPRASHWVQQEKPEVVSAMLAAFARGERVPEAWEVERISAGGAARGTSPRAR